MISLERPYAHCFVDLENVPKARLADVYSLLVGKYNLKYFDVFSAQQPCKAFMKMAGETLRFFQPPKTGKNSADIAIAVAIAEAVLTEENMERIVIVSSDRDFIVPVMFALKYGKKVDILYHQGSGELFSLMEKYNGKITFIEMESFAECGAYLPKDWVSKLETNRELLDFFYKHYRGDNIVAPYREKDSIVIPFVDGMSSSLLRQTAKVFGIRLAGKKPLVRFLEATKLILKDDDTVHKKPPFSIKKRLVGAWGEKKFSRNQHRKSSFCYNLDVEK